MWDRKDLKAKGLAAFKANYWQCVLVAVILGIVTAASGSSGSSGSNNDGASVSDTISQTGLSMGMFAAIAGGIVLVGIIVSLAIIIFVKNPLMVGAQRFFIKNSADSSTRVNEIVSVFREGRFLNIFATMFLQGLFVVLWSLLFVVPGIMKAYSYRLVPYILADNTDIAPMDALKLSQEMMNGHRMNAFILDLSFIGWFILTLLTCGLLGIFYVNPYYHATNAELYLAIKNN